MYFLTHGQVDKYLGINCCLLVRLISIREFVFLSVKSINSLWEFISLFAKLISTWTFVLYFYHFSILRITTINTALVASIFGKRIRSQWVNILGIDRDCDTSRFRYYEECVTEPHNFHRIEVIRARYERVIK